MIQIDRGMPKNCSECPGISYTLFDRPFCNIKGMHKKRISDILTTSRHPDCPLREVKWQLDEQRQLGYIEGCEVGRRHSINAYQKRIHEMALEHGWWDDDEPNIPEKLALIHSEVSEALEDYRDGKMKLVTEEVDHGEGLKPVGFPTELADIIIRCFDLATYLRIDLEAVIHQKIVYNGTRPYKHGGKVC